ncbi:MAG: hypothetical protein LUH47_02855 [Clostridiales bacterium]|nr:hypothetical protein [Clostridiales bacterium]
MNEISNQQPNITSATQSTTAAAKQPVVNFPTVCVITLGIFGTVCVFKGYKIEAHLKNIDLDFCACPAVSDLAKAA